MSTITATVTTTITTIPLLRHRDTVVNFPADQDDFVAKYEATNDHLSVSTVPQINAVGDQIDIITGQINTVAGEVNTNAGIATTKAGEALTSANAAALSASNALASENAAAATYDAFDDRELGSKATPPTLDNDGNALQEGAQYWNTVSKKKFLWNGTIWVDQTIIPTDHGSLTGLADDDHPQYHNDTRGDARYLKLVGGNLTGALNTARAIVASSATTSDIWGALGNQIDFTGTANVTAFPNAPQAGAERTLICAGACSFTAGANMVIDGVPSGTVTCATNDKIIVRATSTTTFNLTRLKADGTSQVSSGGGSMIFLSIVTASNSATVDIENTFDSTYDRYVIEAVGVTTGNDGVQLQARLKIGGVYVSDATYYGHSTSLSSDSATYNNATAFRPAAGDTAMTILSNSNNAANCSSDFTMTLSSPSNTTFMKSAYWIGRSNGATSTSRTTIGAGHNSGVAALTGVRFLAQAGNILAGTFRLYGIKNS